MGDPMTDPKKRGRQEQKPHDWPPAAHVEPLQATVSDWSRELNQRVDNPGTPNPKRTRAQREAYRNSGGQP